MQQRGVRNTTLTNVLSLSRPSGFASAAHATSVGSIRAVPGRGDAGGLLVGMARQPVVRVHLDAVESVPGLADGIHMNVDP